MSYLVSINVPVYQVEDYIERCVTSVMHQTYNDSSIECILVDDCTPDKSIAVAQRLIDGYHGNIDFKIIRNEKNSGVAVARNNGMKHATGKYIFFLDADDVLKDDCLQVLFGALTEHPDAEMIMGNNFHEKRNKPYIDYQGPSFLNNDQLLKAFYQEKIPPVVWNSLILRDVIVRNNLSFRPGRFFEDNLWSLKLYPCVNKFVYVPQITLIYEDNPSSFMNSVALQAAKIIPHEIANMKEYLSSFDYVRTVDYTIFVTSSMLKMLDISSLCEKDLREKVKALRSQLLKNSLKHGRLILVFYELWMYNPLNKLLRFHFFRQNFHYIKKATYTVASLFNPLHPNKRK